MSDEFRPADPRIAEMLIEADDQEQRLAGQKAQIKSNIYKISQQPGNDPFAEAKRRRQSMAALSANRDKFEVAEEQKSATYNLKDKYGGIKRSSSGKGNI